MSCGLGGIVSKSMKQKLNTKSLTEAEVVGASDYLPHTLWVTMFMEAQGYAIQENYLKQDNESAIKLEKNGRSSAGAKSRHIDVRSFWIKDRTKSAGITVRHCPTLHMLADFFTKPLQGSLFRKFRDVILGYKHVDSLVLDTMSEPEERVESKQSADIVTGDPEEDGFVLVTRKKSMKNKRISLHDDVAAVPHESSCNVATPRTITTDTSMRNGSISRVHSLEIIQLMK